MSSSAVEEEDDEHQPFFDAPTPDSAAELAPSETEAQSRASIDEGHELRTRASVDGSGRSQGNNNRSPSGKKSLSRRHSSYLDHDQRPAVPPIPAHFLHAGRPASIASRPRLPLDSAPEHSKLLHRPRLRPAAGTSLPPRHHRQQHPPPPPPPPPRPSTSHGVTADRRLPPRHDAMIASPRRAKRASTQQHPQRPDFKRASSLPPPTLLLVTPTVDVHTLSQLERRAPSPSKMSHSTTDLFLELANQDSTASASDENLRPMRSSDSRAAYASKRQSLPTENMANASDRRPSTGGNTHARTTSRLSTSRRQSSDLQRHMDQYRSPTNRTLNHLVDAASFSGRSDSAAHARRTSLLPDNSPASPSRLRSERVQSPTSSHSDHKRDSFGTAVSSQRHHRTSSRYLDAQDDSPAEGSEGKQAESTDAESNTADTVWDELDDLKSRIKKLEFGGRMPTTSSATASGDSSDRPRTATTAPTTVDYSPRHDRKSETGHRGTPTPSSADVPGGRALANIHLPLHAALAKAKPLLNASLYRILEATATDTLHLAASTGSTGSQGAALSTTSLANGGTTTDRHVRRKADSVARNLTDLCLALCEGKHEAPTVVSSPTIVDDAAESSPLLRYSSRVLRRSPSAAQDERISNSGRPMSRLEARRSSILGASAFGSFDEASRRGSESDVSVTEQDSTVSHLSQHQPRRISRAPSSLQHRRRSDRGEASEDDDPTVRPASRATSDIAALRAHRVRGAEKLPETQRAPSLRESLSRRTNEASSEMNRDATRIASLGSDFRRRRPLYDHQSTPPVIEEDFGITYHQPSVPRQRSHYGGRRTTIDHSPRTMSLGQRRQVIVE